MSRLKVVQADHVGIGAASDAGIEGIDGRHLLGGQLEVEHVEILGHAGRRDRLRDHRAAMLHAPAQHDLRCRLAVRLGDFEDRRVLQRAFVAAAIKGDAADGRPGLGQDAMLSVQAFEFGLLEIGMQLDLVDRGHHLDRSQQVFEVMRP